MSVESRLLELEESLRNLRNANRLQGRRFSAEAPDNGDVAAWGAANSLWEPTSGVTIIDRDLTEVEIVDDTDEGSIYSHSIPANTLGATGGIRVTVAGDYLNNDGAARDMTFRIKLGATTLLTSKVFASVNNAARRKWVLEIWMMNTATNAQRCSATLAWSGPDSSNFPVQDTATTSGRTAGAGYGTGAEDTTGALTFDVTADHGTGAANLSTRKEMAIMELLSEV